MYNNRFILFLEIISFMILVSCRAYKIPVSSGVSARTSVDYINTYKNIAISEMNRTGVPASIILAQGMIESDYGRSRLTREANNHFGIKCHDNWRGPTFRQNDDYRNECFRKYRHSEESFKDHSDFLKTEPRYSFLFNLDRTDYKKWAIGLKKAGYASNPDYANMLIRKIEEYNLNDFDVAPEPGKRFSSGSPDTKDQGSITGNKNSDKSAVEINDNISVPARNPRIMERNRIMYIIVKDGDTRESLEKEFQLLRWELPRYNEIKPDFNPVPDQILYLQPKREKAEPGKEFHTVAEGETMYQISQYYGIKLKNLYAMNRMTVGSEPVADQKLWLRKVKPVN